MGTFKSLSLTDCEVHGPALDMTTYLHNINQNGDKALDLNLDLPYDLDATQIMVNLLHIVLVVVTFCLVQFRCGKME